MGNNLLKIIVSLLISGLCLIVFGCSGWVYKVPTGAMIPTIQIGDKIIVNKFAYASGEIERFDIILFVPPKEQREKQNSDSPYTKRVIGLPNEKLEIKDNKIYINDKLLKETFDKIVDKKDFKKDYPANIIPDNEYFMLGDNRPNSEDSRYWKQRTIHKKDILGKVVEIIPKD